MAGWRLGIDFGTTYTVAAIWQDGVTRIIDLENNGNSRLPSAVFLTEDDETLVGTAATHQAVFAPERFEPTPKRAIGEGEIFLGERLVPVAELVAAVLRRVYGEACRQQGEAMPDAVNITHPAGWSTVRLDVLHEAALQAGISNATLLPEPVAAAARIAANTPTGGHVAVYDFGGGTFDAAVLTQTASGFEVAGPPAGRDPLGGEDIDRRIISYLGGVVGEDNEAWLAITNPSSAETRRQASELREEVQRAKETLSEIGACQLWVPGVARGVQITRAELEQLITPDIDATVETMQTALDDAGMKPADLVALYLVGGSSRIPLVADTIWRQLQIKPKVQDNPKNVVALGAAAWAERHAATVPGTATTEPIDRVDTLPLPTSTQPPATFRGKLAADISLGPWPAGSAAVFQVTVDYPGPDAWTLRGRDEPAGTRTSQSLATEVAAFRQARTPSFRDLGTTVVAMTSGAELIERQFSMKVGSAESTMIERYVVADGRAIVVAAPADRREVADAVTLSPDAPPADTFTMRLRIPLEPASHVNEQVIVRRETTPYSFIAERYAAAEPVDQRAYLGQRIDLLLRQLKAASLVATTEATVMTGLRGTIATLRWRSQRDVPMLTKLGVAANGIDVYTVTISLPHQDQSQFSSLARQVRVTGPG